MPDPAELRAQFLKLRASGASLPKAVAVPRAAAHSAPPRMPDVYLDGSPEERRHQLARALAEHWGWLALMDSEYAHYCEVQRADGATISLTSDGWNKAGRIRIGPRWPKSSTDHYEFSDREISAITVSDARSVDSIAKDIESRLLPGFLKAWGKCEQDREAHDAVNARMSGLTEDLAALVGTETRSKGYGNTGPKHCFDVGCYNTRWRVKGEVSAYHETHSDGRSVELNVECSAEQAKAILRLLAETPLEYENND